MTGFRQRAIDRFKAGDRFTASRRFCADDIQLFARFSRDYNLAHFDACFAEAGQLKATISHELLMASLMNEIGSKIGWLAAGASYYESKPIYTGDLITCEWLIKAMDDRGQATASVTMTNQAGTRVMAAEMIGRQQSSALPFAT